MAHEGVQRLRQALHVTMQILGISKRDAERQLGWSYGYLSRLSTGRMELKMEHVLQLVEVVGLTPAELFRFAYPPGTSPPSQAATRIREVLGSLDAFSAIPPEEDLETRVRSLLQKILAGARP